MKKNWKNFIYEVTLITLTLFVMTPAGVGAEVAGDGQVVGTGKVPSAKAVDVSLSSDDANEDGKASFRRDEMSRLREEVAALKLDNESLSAQNEALNRELFEQMMKNNMQSAAYRTLQLSVAEALARGSVREIGDREAELVRVIGFIADDGVKLAMNASGLCEVLTPLIPQLPIGKDGQADIVLRLEQLKKDSAGFIRLAGSDLAGESARRCTVLAVDEELGVAVISAGFNQGVVNGLVYYADDGNIRMQVVAVRPFVSAVKVLTGRIGRLKVGMEAVTEVKEYKTQ